MDSNQKIFAEKAINDVLFEAQLGTLNRYSVQINPQSTIENYIRSSTASTDFSGSSAPQTLHNWTEHSTSTTADNVLSLSETGLQSYFTSFNE